MLNAFAAVLDELDDTAFDLTPARYGLVTACDGGLLEVSGLNAPVGALCEVAHGLAPLTAEVIGFRGAISHDLSKPDGTPRKQLNVDKINSLGWKYKTPLKEGIIKTYNWFLNNSKKS